MAREWLTTCQFPTSYYRRVFLAILGDDSDA